MKSIKNKLPKIFLSLLLLLIPLTLIGCDTPEAAPTSKEYEVLDNDLAEGSLSVDHYIPGEQLVFTTRYSTSYDATEWHITDSKALNISATISPISDSEAYTATVLIDNVHIDATITSQYALMNGVLQDTMDDHLHTGDQAGFLISPEYNYENIFVIEGYTEYLIEGWAYYNGSYGYADLTQTRLTEDNLVNRGGVNGNKFSIVYDLLIRYEGEEYFHTRSVIDEFIVPVSSPETDNHPTNTSGTSNMMVAPASTDTSVFKDVTVLYDVED